MVLIEDKQLCCGCGACVNVCHQEAIKMVEDEKGFFYPQLDGDKCIECGLCKKSCVFQGDHKKENTIREVYSLQHTSSNVIEHSSSGGAFTALSDVVLKEQGAIYGAALDGSDFSVVHNCALNATDRDKFRESKYVQSSIVNVFEDIKSRLDKGQQVLFSGTPCQCAAINGYIKSKKENLIIIELLCHGVPSNRILKDHIHLWEKKTGKRAINYHYRSKKYGYEHTHLIEFEDGTENHSIELKRLLKLYAVSMRPSCYNCPYASRSRQGDITIGDLWEAGKAAGIMDHRGTSTVLVNSDKGKKLLEKASNNCSLKTITLDLDNIGALNHCVQKSNSVDKFWKTYSEQGYEAALDKFAPNTMKSSIYQNLLRVLYITKTDRLYTRIKAKL